MQATSEHYSAPHEDQISTIEAALSFLCDPEQVVELRILNTPRGTVSGYFTDMTRLAKAAAQWNGRCDGVYIMLNLVNSALLARACNRIVERVKVTTSDVDVERRLWLLLDFDSTRPTGISATDAEHQGAIARAQECLTWLRSLGFIAYIVADSGNGAHILLRIDLPNDATSTDLVKRCLEAVALRFSDDTVAVDLTVYNAARICKLYGTKACKGDNTPDRPHRTARILEVAESLAPESQDLLERLAALAPEPPKAEAQHKHDGTGTFDLSEWIAKYRLNAAGPYPWKDGRKWIFPTCPFNTAHNNRAAVLFQFANGAIAFRCLHNGCAGQDWHALRDLFEPGWRNGNHERQTDYNKPGDEKRAESPRPLSRELPKAPLYPVAKLRTLAPVAVKLHATIQAPLASCGQSVLAAAGLAVQGHANILIDGREIPLCENFLTIGESGERKSAVDTEVLRPHRAYEKQITEKYKEDLQAYENDFAAYKRSRDEALKKAKTRAEKKQALEAIGPAPLEPLLPILIAEEPTYEGLIKLLLGGRPSLGLFTDEGGRFIGGYGMSEEQQLKTAAGLCELWDGKRVSRVRAGDGATVLYGKRVSTHLMAQPLVAQRVLGNPLLIGQGYMSRCLSTWPTSTAGTRLYKAVNLREDRDLKAYEDHIMIILTMPLPLADKKHNELDSGQTDPDLILAEKLLAWIQQRGKYVALVDIYQRGLNAISDAATARRLAGILAAHGWLIPVPKGMEINGQFRREVWSVVEVQK